MFRLKVFFAHPVFQIDKMNFTAIIPARKFDKVIPDKNVLPIGNTNLLSHKIDHLSNLRQVKKIIVSSETEDYGKYCTHPKTILHIRSSNISTTVCPFSKIVMSMYKHIDTEYVLLAPVITPFLFKNDFQKAIKIFLKAIDSGHDSLMTVAKTKRIIFDGNGPINLNYAKFRKPRPTLYEYVNGITIAPTSEVINWNHFWGLNPYLMIINSLKSITICDKRDYFVAKHLFTSAYV